MAELVAQVAPGVPGERFDEALGIRREKPARVPVGSHPETQRPARVQNRDQSHASPGDSDGGGEDGDPVPLAGQRDERAGGSALEKHAWVGVQHPARGIEPSPRAETRAQQEEHLLDEVGHFHGPASGQPMPGRDHGQQATGKQQTPAEPWVAAERQRQVDLPRLEAVQDLGPAVLDELQRDTRRRTVPAGEEARQAFERLGRRPEAKHPRLTGPERASTLAQRLRAGQEVAALRE